MRAWLRSLRPDKLPCGIELETLLTMKQFVLILFLAACTAAASAQTAPKASATKSATPKNASSTSTTTKPSTAKPSTTARAPEPWIKLPPGVPRVAHGPVMMPFAVRYEDINIGAGAEGEPGQLWHMKYTAWLAADGVEFDSWEDHNRQPVVGKDGKPELGPDGKPKMGDPDPLVVRKSMHNIIPGVDYGIEGMKIGGKRRIFVPWQLAFGTQAIPARPGHPAVPAKSDLIFDMELVNVTELPQHQYPPASGAQPQPGASAQPSAAPTAPAAPASTAPPAAKPATATPAQPAAAAQPTTPAQPAAPAQPQTQPK